jgi:hypothetical protein
MDVSIDTTHFRLTSRRHGWEQVAECIRQQRIVKLWMHFRDARAEFEARAPYRRERGLLLQGALIVRDALRAGPTCLELGARQAQFGGHDCSIAIICPAGAKLNS